MSCTYRHPLLYPPLPPKKKLSVRFISKKEYNKTNNQSKLYLREIKRFFFKRKKKRKPFTHTPQQFCSPFRRNTATPTQLQSNSALNEMRKEHRKYKTVVEWEWVRWASDKSKSEIKWPGKKLGKEKDAPMEDWEDIWNWIEVSGVSWKCACFTFEINLENNEHQQQIEVWLWFEFRQLIRFNTAIKYSINK